MDILAHALWSSLPYRFANLKKKAKKIQFLADGILGNFS
jgi:hypothetical protein